MKSLVLSAAIIFANVALFSRAFVGLDMGANIFAACFGVSFIVVSAALFFVFNYRLLFPRASQPAEPAGQTTLEAAEASVRRYIAGGERTFRLQLNTVLKQIGRMKSRLTTVAKILAEHFSAGEMSERKFTGTVTQVENVMILNVNRLIHRLSAFDEDEYAASINPYTARDDEITRKRRVIFAEYEKFVAQSVENNEEILLRVDRLILEMSKLSDFSEGSLNDMDAMRELDALISDTKWYKS